MSALWENGDVLRRDHFLGKLVISDGRPILTDSLADTIASLHLDLSRVKVRQIEQYCQMLWEWNAKLNLTRHTDFETIANRDVLDSYQLAQCIEPSETVCDIGAGGGVPGIILQILRPDVRVTLCEPTGKKAKALEDMVQRLGLHCPVHAKRIQDLLVTQRFQTLVARAVGPIKTVLTWVKPYWGSFDRLVLIKGPRWVDERKEARHLGLFQELELRKLLSYPMPNASSESVILGIWRPDPEPKPQVADDRD